MKKILSFCAALFMTFAASAAVWNITPSHCHEGDRSDCNLYVTLDRGAQAGDTIVLADGTYLEPYSTAIKNNVVIMAAEGAHPLIQQSGYFEVKANAKVMGLKFQFVGEAQNGYGFYIKENTQKNLIVEDCEFTAFTKYCFSSSSSAHVDSVIIKNCLFHGLTSGPVYFGPSNREDLSNLCDYLAVTNSTFYDIDINGWVSVIDFRNNDGGSWQGNANTMLVDHCTFYNIHGEYNRIIMSYKSANATVSNCIIVNNPENNSFYPTYNYGGSVINNLTYNTGSHRSGPTRTDNITGDPLFADAANADFHLGEGSPALNAGSDGSHLGDPRWYPAPAPSAVTYRIGGDNPDYATLNLACKALNATPITADVELLICGNLTEPVNPVLVNGTDFSITIRPDQDADRTIQFTAAKDNSGPSGAFVIGGVRDAVTGGDTIGWHTALTKNIIIDGYAEGGSTRRLTFLTADGFGSKAGPIIIYGNCENVAIKNCIVKNTVYHTSTSTFDITVRTEKGTDVTPRNILIENNQLFAVEAYNGQCIQFNGSQRATLAGNPHDVVIRNNELNAATRGIFFNGATDITIEGNVFKVNQVSGGRLSHGIMGNSQSGTITVRGNKFAELNTVNATSGDYGIQAITASGGANAWVIENNVFYGFGVGSACAGKDTKVCGIRCGDSCVVRNNTFYMPVLAYTPTTALMSAYPIACLYFAGSKAYVAENNIFVSMETAANNSLIRGGLNPNVKNNAFYHAGGNAAILAGAANAMDYKAFMPKADAGSVWTMPVFTDAANGDFSVALNGLLVMPRNAEVLKDINGNDRRDNTYAGAYEGPEYTATRYMAGTGAGDWCDGKSWDAAGTAMPYGKIHYAALPAGPYEFKVTNGTWDNAIGYSNVLNECKANKVVDAGGNIKFWLGKTSPVAIQMEGDSVRVVGDFVDAPTYYIAGNADDDANGIWCSGKQWDAAGTPLFGDSIVYNNLQTGVVFQFKVTNGTWNNALGYSAVLDECKANYVYDAGGNIAFRMAEAGKVVIKVVDGAVGVYGNFADPNAIVIDSYTVVGDAALLGAAWDVNAEANNMTENEGVWTLVKNDVVLTAGTYEYKVVGNHSYSVFQHPGQGNQNYVFNEDGTYNLTFTFVPGETPVLTLNAVKQATGLDNTTVGNEPVKFFRNGQVYIRRDGVVYTLTGVRVE